jgi:NitT/TauT family transport system substrate-binding protein
MKKRTKVIFAGLVIGCLLGACKEKAKTAEADYTIKVGIPASGSLCSAPFFIAREKGFYAAEGLKFEEVKVGGGQTDAQLLTSGQIDVENTLLGAIILPIANGLDVKIPLAVHTGCIKALVRPDSDIKTPSDLKGRKIGVASMNATPTIIVQRYLGELGIGTTPNNMEVEWLIYPSSELPLALEQGQVDAIAINEPAASIVESKGNGRVIIDTAKDDFIKDEYCCMLVASASVFKNHPETLAKFARALQKAAYYVQENPAETARLMAEAQYVAGDPDLNGRVLATYNFRAAVGEAQSAIERNARDLQRIGLIDASVDVDALTKNTFVALPGVPDKL